jgi:hypothetical protein
VVEAWPEAIAITIADTRIVSGKLISLRSGVQHSRS